MRKMIVAILLMSSVAGTALAQGQTVKKLKNCGSEASNSFGSHKEYPAKNEGNGYVSFQTSDQDATGTKLRYSLVNCATRTLVRVEAEYLLANSSAGVEGGDLFVFTDGLRKSGKLVNEPLLARLAKQRAYKVTQGKLPERFDERAKRSDCGCASFYPDIFYGSE